MKKKLNQREKLIEILSLGMVAGALLIIFIKILFL